MALITPQLSYDGFDQADIVVEAVFEGMALKRRIFGEIDAIAKPSCILASNTSTLDIDEIASATERPQMVIGHLPYFFSPANVMRLLEVVRGKTTGKEVIATSMALGKRLKKVAVLAGNCRGFIGNRMLGPYRRRRSSCWKRALQSKKSTKPFTISASRWDRWPSSTWPDSM